MEKEEFEEEQEEIKPALIGNVQPVLHDAESGDGQDRRSVGQPKVLLAVSWLVGYMVFMCPLSPPLAWAACEP